MVALYPLTVRYLLAGSDRPSLKSYRRDCVSQERTRMSNVRKNAFTCVGHEKVEEVGQNIKAYQKFE